MSGRGPGRRRSRFPEADLAFPTGAVENRLVPDAVPPAALVVFLACCGVASRRSGADPRGRRRRPQVDRGHEGRRRQPAGGRLQGGPRHAAAGSPGRRSSTTTARPTCAAPRPRRSSAIASSSASSATRPRRRSSPRRGRSTARTSVDALSRAKNVTDVVIWNEANSALFWRPQQGARSRRTRRCWRVLRHAPQVPAHGERDHARPRRTRTRERSCAPLGDAYRASGRAAPIFDTFGHNAYPETTRESPYARTRRAVARPGRLRAADGRADRGVRRHRPARARQRDDRDAGHRHAAERAARRCSWPVTIWYLEDGFETVVAARQALRATPGESRTGSSCSRSRRSCAAPHAPTRRASSRTRSSSPTASPPSARSSTSSSSTRSARRLAVGPALGRRHAEAVVRRRQGARSPASLPRTVDCSRFPFVGDRAERRAGRPDGDDADHDHDPPYDEWRCGAC